MNPYKNTLQKVKVLLKEDDNLTKNQCEQCQWQLLVKVPGDYSFTVGKGGVNTIFYSESSVSRSICYPDEMVSLLEKLSKGKVFVYVALDKKKKSLGYSISRKVAKKFKGACFIASVDFKGKTTLREQKEVDLYGKKSWQPVNRNK